MLEAQVKNPLVGSDVEYFLVDKLSGEIVSAEPFIKGTKENPFRFDPKNQFFATQLDNVMAEGNIPPASTSYMFLKYMTDLRSYINNTIPARYQTLAAPAAILEDKYLQTETAARFGCDPSLNAWTGETVEPKPTGDKLRSAGFHIHVGYESPNSTTNVKLAKALDLFLGVPSVLLEPQNSRKKVGYGLAGNMRHQPHGVEYRTLSSFFAGHKKLIEWVYKNTHSAIDAINQGYFREIDRLGKIIQHIINNEDKEEARTLLKYWEIRMPA